MSECAPQRAKASPKVTQASEQGLVTAGIVPSPSLYKPGLPIPDTRTPTLVLVNLPSLVGAAGWRTPGAGPETPNYAGLVLTSLPRVPVGTWLRASRLQGRQDRPTYRHMCGKTYGYTIMERYRVPDIPRRATQVSVNTLRGPVHDAGHAASPPSHVLHTGMPTPIHAKAHADLACTRTSGHRLIADEDWSGWGH